MSSSTEQTIPFLTDQLPGIGGKIKAVPEDFLVEEIPVYEPCGEGEHLFLWVQKQGLSAEQLIDWIARQLAVSRREIGTAGMKDRQALTRQYVSVPARCADRIESLESDQVTILDARRHRNKLKTGHLRGNRFEILVRDPVPGAEAKAHAILASITRDGFPNYYGEQRFGSGRKTLALGWDLLRGDKPPREIRPARRRFLLRLALSAVQSELFNRVLGG